MRQVTQRQSRAADQQRVFPAMRKGVILDGAGGNWAGADLRGRNFNKAQLQHANFHCANLRGAQFRLVDARGAIFDDADLTAADFTGALLQGARFRGAQLHRAVFRQAFLLSAHLEQARVQGATFAGANLEWAWLEGVEFHEVEVACALFLNVRGLSPKTAALLEAQGGFTGTRQMILGRELYEQPLPAATQTLLPQGD